MGKCGLVLGGALALEGGGGYGEASRAAPSSRPWRVSNGTQGRYYRHNYFVLQCEFPDFPDFAFAHFLFSFRLSCFFLPNA